MKVNICGIPHDVEIRDDTFTSNTMHMGEIRYKECKIYLSSGMPKALEKETLVHEMLHGIFVHLGHNDLASDEVLVQSLAQAISQGFEVKEYEEVYI